MYELPASESADIFKGSQSAQDIILDVWMDNFFEAIDQLSTLITEGYCYVAMDTEFPGTVFFPNEVSPDFEY
jgi:hypothetical protein